LSPHQVNIPLVDDTIREANETINLTLSNPSGASLGIKTTATLTIIDNDPAGSVAFSSPVFTVNENGTPVSSVAVTRTNGTASGVTVIVTLSNGTATAPNDFSNSNIKLSFGSGETIKTFNIPIVDDNLYEGNETINLTLFNPTGGGILGSQRTAVVTIQDNDTLISSGSLAFSESTYKVNENGAPVKAITITRTGGSNGAVTVLVTPSNNTAIAPNDFSNSKITLSFASGETSKTLNIPIVDDNLYEGEETLNLTLSNPTAGSILGSQKTALLTITDNETIGGLGATTRISQGSNGEESNGSSRYPLISGDGRYVAFHSSSTNLVAGDTNGRDDIFLYDTVKSTTIRVSQASNGDQANDNSGATSISADGRYVSYSSFATNLVPNDTNNSPDVFVYDTATQTTKRVSVTNNGVEGTGGSYSPSISADGRYVAYWSMSDNLVTGDTNNSWDVFLYDTLTGTTKLVSVDNAGNQGNLDSHYPSISGNGRYVSYWSKANNLVPGDTNNLYDVFLYDTLTQTTTLVSVNNSGTQGNITSLDQCISLDGGYIAYRSFANNLVPSDTNNKSDIFVYNTNTKTATRVSVDSKGNQANGESYSPFISGDGRYVTYHSEASNLVPQDTNATVDIFAYDTVTKTTIRVSVDSKENQSNGGSYYPSISASGSYVAYESYGNNLSPNDSNGAFDIFVKTLNFNASTSFAFSASTFSVNENGTPVKAVTITRTNGINSALSVVLQPSNGTATAPNDFTNSHITVSFDSSETSKTVNIPIINDTLYEGNETVNLTLSNPTGGSTLGTQKTAVLTIVDNDPLPIFTFSNTNYQVSEEGNPLNKAITINRSGASTVSAIVILRVTNGTAITPVDYNNSPITLSFGVGETTKTVSIPIINDGTPEPNETINLSLSNPIGATLGTQKTALLTIIENDTATTINQTGTHGNDTITGKIGNDLIYGNEGNDSLNGITGNDSLYGNEGNDSLTGREGNDSLDAGEGNDKLEGEIGNDHLDAGEGNDSLDGGEGNDGLYGRTGDDFLNGRIGNDSLNGGIGNDFLNGETGHDFLNGGGENDTLTGDEGNDTFIGWTGNDYLEGSFGNDSLDGGEENDTLISGTENDTLYGGIGNDSLDAGAGNDSLDSGEGNDSLIGGEGNDTLNGWTGNDSLTGGIGNDELSGFYGNNTLMGEAGNDTLNGWKDHDSLFGGIGSDNIKGFAGNDTIDGATDNDILLGGEGNDSLVGGDGNDTLTGYQNVLGELDDLDGGDTGNDLYLLNYDLPLGFIPQSNNKKTFSFESKAIINSRARIKKMKKTDKIRVKNGTYTFKQSGKDRLLYRILPSSNGSNEPFSDNNFQTKGSQEFLWATILNNNWVNSSYLIF